MDGKAAVKIVEPIQNETITPASFIKGKVYLCPECGAESRVTFTPYYPENDAVLASRISPNPEAMLAAMYDQLGKWVQDEALCQRCGDEWRKAHMTSPAYSLHRDTIITYIRARELCDYTAERMMEAIVWDLDYQLAEEKMESFRQLAPESFEQNIGVSRFHLRSDKEKRIRRFLNDINKPLLEKAEQLVNEARMPFAVRLIFQMDMTQIMDELKSLLEECQDEELTFLDDMRMREPQTDGFRTRHVSLDTPNLSVYSFLACTRQSIVDWYNQFDPQEYLKVNPMILHRWAEQRLAYLLEQ